MRRLIALLIAGIAVACHAPKAERDALDGAEKSSSSPGLQESLIFNLDTMIPIVAAFGNGTLRMVSGCLIFETNQGSFTPVWPLGTRWGEVGIAVVTPAGGRFVLGKPVVLPGGAMGSVTGSDLKPSAIPDKGCPQEYFGVHTN